MEHWRRSPAAARSSGDRRLEGNSAAGVAKSRIALGDVAAVQVELRQALAIFEELDDPDADEMRRLLATHSEA